jgi:phage-related protein
LTAAATLLHGLVKKSKRTPLNEYRLACRRLAELREGGPC